MRKHLLIGIALLAAGCSKKEVAPYIAHASTNPSAAGNITWTQGNAIRTGTYNIFTAGNANALEISNGSAVLNSFTNHYQQRWIITEASDGYFTIQNAGSGKYLSASGNSLKETLSTSADGHLWKIQHQKLGLYSIVNKATAQAITLNDNKITQMAYSGANKQLLSVNLVDYALAIDSVTIDFSNVSGNVNHVAAGFLHGITGSSTPADSLLLPLQINTLRDWIFDYDLRGPRIASLGYKEQLVISDGFAQPYNSNGPPGNNNDWTAWENTVAGTVTQAMKTLPSAKLQYDIWNEPNGGGFWNFTGQYAFPQWFFETWKHGYNKIHSIDPNAVTVGPSYSSYDVTNLKAFLLYCKQNNCVPNYLSWHFPTDPVAQVAEMKQFMSDNGIHVDGFYINEYTLAAQQTAGKNAYLIGQLERAQVTGAMHAIWGSTQPGQLDGVVTTDGQKLATWWVYKYYGDIQGNIVSTVPSANIELFAGYIPHKELNVLLGCRAQAGQGTIKVKCINVSPNQVDHQTTVHLKMRRIPDALNVGAVTNTLPVVIDQDVTVVYGGAYTLLINWNSEYDAYQIKVSKALNPVTGQ